MTWEIEWSPESRAWLQDLPNNLRRWCRDSFQSAVDIELDVVVVTARQEAARMTFEGDLVGSINRTSFVIGRGMRGGPAVIARGMVSLSPDATIVDASDVLHALTPFSYGWAKHAPGAGEHRVMLYNPRTGGSTKNRQKLVRYLKSKGPNWDQLPAAPTKETWEGPGAKDLPPPFVTVHPHLTATNYLLGQVDAGGDPLLSLIVERAYDALAAQWSR